MFPDTIFYYHKLPRKQPKCPSTLEWIKKIWYVYTMECYSVIKKDEIMPFAATRMELETVTLSEVSQTEKDKYMISLIMQSKSDRDELVYKAKIDLQTLKPNLWLPKGKGEGEG